jgi:hypothetical protein
MRGMTKSYKLGAGAAGEMVEVDTSVHLAVDSSDGGTHSVDALLTVSVGINDLAGELDEFLILKRKLPARHDHARRLRASDALGVRGQEQKRSRARTGTTGSRSGTHGTTKGNGSWGSTMGPGKRLLTCCYV